MVIAGTLAHVDLLGFLICQIGIVDEVIVEDDVGGIDGFRCLDGKEILGRQDRSLRGIRCLAYREMLLEVQMPASQFTSFLSGDGKEALKRMGWEREYFGDFILHAESLQGTGGNDGSIVFAIFHLLNSFFNTAAYAFDGQVWT